MATKTEKLKVVDRQGFQYEVILEHKPQFGFSSAIYCGRIIGQVQLGRILEPLSDDDRDWERYQELYSEWADEIRSNMKRICENHFNN